MLASIFHSRLGPQESLQHIPADDPAHFQFPAIYIHVKSPTSRHELKREYEYMMERVYL